MEPRIETIKAKYLVGMHMEMTLSDNKTQELWQRFMPLRGQVKNRVNSDYISMQVYDENQENLFAPDTPFTKWAVVEVERIEEIPPEMKTYTLNGGMYAVFIHNGPVTTFPKTMRSIFGSWLPESTYELDNREHFEVLPENYQPMAPDAREEVWIPIRNKAV